MRSIWFGLIAVCLSSFASATPWFTQDPKTLKQGMWRVEEHVLYSPFDSALVDGDEVPLTAVREFDSLTLHTRIRYGVEDNLTVFVDIPWVFRDMTDNSGASFENDDLGDIVFLAKGKYYHNKEKRALRAFALSVKTHTGEFLGLPPPLATGTGTKDWTLTHLYERGIGDTTWYCSLGYTVSGQRDDILRDPGDVAFFNVAAEHKLFKSNWNFVWEINARHQRESTDATGKIPDSDSTIISLSPGVQHVRARPGGRLLTLEAGVQVPVITDGNAPSIPDFTFYGGGYLIF